MALIGKIVRRLWLLCLIIACIFFFYPISNLSLKILFLLAAGWVVVALGCWLWRWRWGRVLCGVGAAAAFLILLMPGRQPSAALRDRYTSNLAAFESVPYVWGGENGLGIDCSGLVRRGMINAAFKEGLATANPGVIRFSLWTWWFDCSARDLGDGYNGRVRLVLEAEQINGLDHRKIAPGDFAIVARGTHAMAYLGNNKWIEADPALKKVIVVEVPYNSPWFKQPARIMRWQVIEKE